MATIIIDTTTAIVPVDKYFQRAEFGPSFQEMDEMERLFGDFRDHNSVGHMDFGCADSPLIRAVNVQDIDALDAYVAAKGWRIVNV